MYFLIGLSFTAAAVCFVVWLWLNARQSNTNSTGALKANLVEAEIVEEDVTQDLVIPKDWDEEFIKHQLSKTTSTADVIAHYIDALKKIFIIIPDLKLAKKRLDFLRTAIEHRNIKKEYLKAEKEVQVALDELEFHDLESKIRRAKLELEEGDLATQRKRQQELDALELERDKLKIKLESTKLNREIDEIENPPEPPPPPPLPPPQPPPPRPPTAKEIRERERAECEDRIKDLKRQKAADIVKMRAAGESEESIRRRENMWDDAIAREEEKLRSLL